MPIYRVNNGINYITSIIWASPYSLIFGCDGGMLYAISFSNDFIRPKIMYINILIEYQMKEIKLLIVVLHLYIYNYYSGEINIIVVVIMVQFMNLIQMKLINQEKQIQ